MIELEALQKALQEGTEAYDKMQGELVMARASLTKILTSKDVKATVWPNHTFFEGPISFYLTPNFMCTLI